jgi:hypothetical protein
MLVEGVANIFKEWFPPSMTMTADTIKILGNIDQLVNMNNFTSRSFSSTP